jgi:hypothetical protein
VAELEHVTAGATGVEVSARLVEQQAVLPGTAVEPVVAAVHGAVVAAEEVVARPAFQDVVPRPAAEVVVAGHAAEGLIQRIPARLGRGAVPGHGVAEPGPLDHLDPGEPVLAGAADDGDPVGAGDERDPCAGIGVANRVAAEPAVEPVVAEAAEQEVVALGRRTGGRRRPPRTAGRPRPRPAGGWRGRFGHSVGVGAALDVLDPDQPVAALAYRHAGAQVDRDGRRRVGEARHVGAGAAVQQVVAVAAAEPVVAALAVKAVVAAAAAQAIRAAAGVDHVAPVQAVDHVVPTLAPEDVIIAQRALDDGHDAAPASEAPLGWRESRAGPLSSW